MAERASHDDSFAAALESEPLPPDVDASGAGGLPLVPSGSLSPVTSSPPAGVLQVAASSENDEHPSAVSSPSTQQPPTSGDGVHVSEHLNSNVCKMYPSQTEHWQAPAWQPSYRYDATRF
jgi:hypothetical protein